MNMKKKIPLGITDYRRLKENNYYVIDKTLMIRDFIESGSKVTLITRPRRFGKTLNMSMLADFFDITKDSQDIFQDTLIASTPYISEMNQYPTIFISFADAKGDIINTVKVIKKELLYAYRHYDVIFHQLDKYTLPIYNSIVDGLTHFDDGKLSTITDALSFLMRCIEDYYHKKVMVFIDEYDTPFIESYVNGFYKDINSDLAVMFQSALKSSTSLQYGMLTGIQRVAKENIFSGMNNLDVCTVNDEAYSQYFGFTEEETKKMLNDYDLDLNQDVKDMYDGYHFCESEMYNPWSIINYADIHELISYWVNTSSNKMIRNAMKGASQNFNKDYESLIINGYLETYVSLSTSFYEEVSDATLWGLFVNAGYLTVTKRISLMDNIMKIEIPNKEIKSEFMSLTEFFFHLEENNLNRMLRALLEGNQERFLIEYKKLLLIPSYHDLVNENSYHMLLLGICLILSDQYKIESNRETGKGRCDIILHSNHDKPSFVIEFKYLKSDKEDISDELNALCNEGLQQIIDKHYDASLTGKIIHIALAHRNKDVMMKWVEK